MKQTGKNRPGRRFSLTFLRGEIESGFSSVQDLLYGKIMFKVRRISETIGKFIKEL